MRSSKPMRDSNNPSLAPPDD
ncbi:unnamed protein product, partial [Rotaria sp. Silwood1]